MYKEYLPMLKEFLYYETIPQVHKKAIAKLIKKINADNSARAEICPWCNGEGLRMTHCSGTMKCRVCKGTGKLSPVA